MSRRQLLQTSKITSRTSRSAKDGLRTLARGTQPSVEQLPPHAMLPSRMFWRSLLVSTVSNNRLLLSSAVAVLSFLARQRGGFFNMNNNLILRFALKKTLYNHFCAGENSLEVQSTIRHIKDMGFRGVILTYAAEVVVDSKTKREAGTGAKEIKDGVVHANVEENRGGDTAIAAWRQGVLETVRMIGDGDHLALKLTGGGAAVADALASCESLPLQMSQALEDICSEAMQRKARILVDAEQQFVQPGIDIVAMDLMRKYNRGQRAVVYNTYQAYLKTTPHVLQRHILQAQKEDFIIGIKLVRGAYINSEPRHLINDTKKDTDLTYNSIARSLLQQQFPLQGPESRSAPFPRIELFLATHNKSSTLIAWNLQKDLSSMGKPLVKVQFGQLLGMADEISCTLLLEKGMSATPLDVYKCLSWGSVGDCISYLLRRAVENRDAVTRTEAEHAALKKEAVRRLKAVFG
ncbi:hypothetical protein QQS21_003666 [Conoideocrella luteorostrata]|uniref:Proline dehydrogenase n=1 Tax=Conoideocrella luteorostrata TaxID=1105319 RepID=A0AAJ0CSY8_9HYPO|nr:hypothetical protein QQS21_003666 [Conoideocrella luteorostrata]